MFNEAPLWRRGVLLPRRSRRMRSLLFAIPSVLVLGAWGTGIARADEAKEKPIEAADPRLDRSVDFERDVYPILDSKCIACHNLAITENGLNLEDVKNILKGGKRGPAVI